MSFCISRFNHDFRFKLIKYFNFILLVVTVENYVNQVNIHGTIMHDYFYVPTFKHEIDNSVGSINKSRHTVGCVNSIKFYGL